MRFSKLTWSEQNNLAENRITEFMVEYDIEDNDDTRRGIISLLEDLGVEIDACSNCGAMPMTVNCNNARCQD